MKHNWMFSSLGSLACLLACGGCAQESASRPAATAAAAQAPVSPMGVTNAQPPSVEPAPAAPSKMATTETLASGTSRSADRTSTAPGPRDRAERLVAAAADQIDQLLRLEGGEEDAQTAIRLDVAAALSDLENRRERVLQDLRALELEPPTRSADLRTQLETDDDQLKQSLDESYLVAPPHGSSDSDELPRPER